MSPHVAAVRRYYDLVDAARFTDMLQLFSDDVVYRRPGYEPLVGILAFRQFYERDRVIADGHHVVEDVVDGPHVVFARGSFAGVLRTGESTSCRWADAWEFDGHLVTGRETFFSAPLI